MHTTRRQFAAISSALAFTALFAGPAQSQSKTLRILVGFVPGGAVDVVARQVGVELRQAGYTAIIENKAGAGGRLATNELLRAPADGNTILILPSGNVTIFPHVFSKLKYKLDDLAPLASVCSFDFGFAVGPGTPARTLDEFVVWAKANPGKASFGMPGAGTAMYFMGLILAKEASFQITPIPYQGGVAAMQDVVGGVLPALASTMGNLIPQSKAGRIRILASSGDKRVQALPNLPTFKELGYPDLVISQTFGFFTSAKVPQAVQADLERALMAAASQPRVVAALNLLDFNSQVMGATEYKAQLNAELAQWGPIVKASGYKVQD